MLLSGTDNHLAGLGTMAEEMKDNQRGKPGYEGYLNKRVVSLPEVMTDGGYHTYMAGKWHLGSKPSQYPSARGFERTFTLLYGGASHWADMAGLGNIISPAYYTMDGKKLDKLPADFYSTRSYSDFMMDAIRENHGDGKPFLAYLAFTAPHDPLHVPEPWLSKYRGRYDDGYEKLKVKRAASAKRLGLVPEDASVPGRHPLIKPWDSLDDESKAREARGMEVYAGMVDNLDYHYGRVVKFLKDIGEYDNTVIIFMSDNGANPNYSGDYWFNATPDGKKWLASWDNSTENIGRPNSAYAYGIGWASGSGGPLDRFKMTVGEGGIRSAMLVAGPGIPGGRKSDAFTYVTDIMATILDMAGLKHPATFHGRKVEALRGKSIAPLLLASQAKIHDDKAYIGGEMFGDKWMRQGDYKAAWVRKPWGPAEWQLHNVKKDPGETDNLADAKPKLLEELTNAWESYAKDVGVVLPEE